jgi:SpoVK/Ycf46/Vps4 family AAA+-type ATPase
VALALREMEVFDGIMILATNRAQMLDEAVHRRISLSVEFAPPDVELRLDIWRKHIPSGLRLSKDVDLGALALEYELSGGLIKNAILQALSSSISRLREERSISQEQIDQGQDFKDATGLEVEDVVISMGDLRAACRLQARGHLKRIKLERRVLPVSGLNTLVTTEKAVLQLRNIVMVEKVRGLMSTRWGFQARIGRSNCVLLFGPQGCGKTFAAGCVGFETGRPLQTISMSEMGGLRDSGAQIGDIFGEASIAGAVVVVEQAEQLLIEASRPEETGSPGLELLYHLQTYNGLVILCCTTVQMPREAGWDVYTPVPNRLSNLLSYVVVLEKPNSEARLRLWRQLLPKSTPREEGLDSKLPEVASAYEFTGARINSCIRRAAAAAAMRANRISLASPSEQASMDSSEARVSVKDVIDSCETELRIRKDTGGLQFYDKLYV